jgi:hypothetical protein
MNFPLILEAKELIKKILLKHDLQPVGDSTEEVLRSYFNFTHKVIVQQPRIVLRSDSLSQKAEELGVSEILNGIERKFVSGEDINPCLSKKIFQLNDHDYLLNDWAIHHLHLSDSKIRETDYFNKRSGLLLFCHVTPETVYFIDIREHGENYVFAQRDLLRVIRDNWADLNKKFQIGGEKMELYPKMDEKGITMLRKKGYMTFTQVDDFAYMPGQGSTSSGFSLEAAREMDAFHRALYKVHSYTFEHGEELKEHFLDEKGQKFDNLQFSLAYKDWMFYVYEVNSGKMVDFDLSGYQPKYPDA